MQRVPANGRCLGQTELHGRVGERVAAVDRPDLSCQPHRPPEQAAVVPTPVRRQEPAVAAGHTDPVTDASASETLSLVLTAFLLDYKHCIFCLKMLPASEGLSPVHPPSLSKELRQFVSR